MNIMLPTIIQIFSLVIDIGYVSKFHKIFNASKSMCTTIT